MTVFQSVDKDNYLKGNGGDQPHFSTFSQQTHLSVGEQTAFSSHRIAR